MRDPGYYFVKYRGNWMIGELREVFVGSLSWELTGDDDIYEDDDFDCIGERITLPVC